MKSKPRIKPKTNIYLMVILIVIVIICILLVFSKLMPFKPKEKIEQKNEVLLSTGFLISECENREFIENVSVYIVEGKIIALEQGSSDAGSFRKGKVYIKIEKYIKKPSLNFSPSVLEIVTDCLVPGMMVEGCSEIEPFLKEGNRVRIYVEQIASIPESKPEFLYAVTCGQKGIEEI